MRTLGLALILAGTLSLLFPGTPWTRRETVLGVGSLQASVEERERLAIPPSVGVIAVAAGLVLLLGRRRTAAGAADGGDAS